MKDLSPFSQWVQISSWVILLLMFDWHFGSSSVSSHPVIQCVLSSSTDPQVRYGSEMLHLTHSMESLSLAIESILMRTTINRRDLH